MTSVIRTLIWFMATASLAGPSLAQDDRFDRERASMVATQIEARDIRDPATLEAMRRVPRHLFVPENRRRHAYQDRPVPIGYGQTISQPFLVAYMTETLQPRPGMRILEIGTGSGYQAAVLAEILDEVFTIEIVGELARWGEANLRSAGYDRVQVRHADGYHGWEEHAPFDAIIVTAAADHIPPPLLAQLRDGGRMVIPVGSPFRTQTLMLVTRDGDDIVTRSLLPVSFVPLTRGDR
jgi:protein-L-isoaspartate(D-aspartate) O-methyltransferase